MGSHHQITVVSTRTVDRFPPDERGVRLAIPGGPAHYIATALDRLAVPYRLITGPPCSVDVLPTPDGQEYLIQPIPSIALNERLAGSATILSPIAREIAPEHVPQVEGILAIDLQGFVRRPGRPTSELETVDLCSLVCRTHVLKASPNELAHLDPASRAVLDRAILLDTRGAEGVSITVMGREHFVAARPVHTTHTIGAGDTFLAAFVSFLLDHLDPVAAAERSARFTEEVLRERLQGD